MGGAQANPTTPVVKRGWVGVTQREGHVQGGGGGYLLPALTGLKEDEGRGV